MNLRKYKREGFIVLLGVVLFFICVIIVFFVVPFSSKDKNTHLYIDSDDTIDSVYYKVNIMCAPKFLSGFKLLSTVCSYKDKIKTGHYEIKPYDNTFIVFKRLLSGAQTPIKITIPSTWTKEMALGQISKKIMIDSAQLVRKFNDYTICKKYGVDTITNVTLLIPDTYEIYWNISAEAFIERMYNESISFWKSVKRDKTDSLNFSTDDIMTLASIVDAETAVDSEKPTIAGLYINRLQAGIPLQSDPTVKFALKDFGLKRIYRNMLATDSPYNTYKYMGLPPGPIRIPKKSSINAVLEYQKHNYIYMCAKEDFSGSHNFASNFNEHKRNAKKYSIALNNIGIK